MLYRQAVGGLLLLGFLGCMTTSVLQTGIVWLSADGMWKEHVHICYTDRLWVVGCGWDWEGAQPHVLQTGIGWLGEDCR